MRSMQLDETRRPKWLTLLPGLVLVMLVVPSCGGKPPSGFTLSLAPAVIDIAPGGAATVTVEVQRVGDSRGEIQLAVSGLPPNVSATFADNPLVDDTTSLEISVGAAVPAGRHELEVQGTGSAVERAQRLTLNVVVAGGAAAPAAEPSGIELTLDSLFYVDGQMLTLTLDFHGVTPPSEVLDVVLSTPESEDVELVPLTRESPGRYVSTKPLLIREQTGGAEVVDEVLTAQPGEMIVALYFLDKSDPTLRDVEEHVVMDFGFLAGGDAGETPVSIVPELALTDDERDPAVGGKPVGTILPAGGLPVQIATEELIFYPKDDAQLVEFLARTGGTVLASQEEVADDLDAETLSGYLIQLDPKQAAVEHLPMLRAFFAEEGELLASKEDALSIYTLALYYQLEGYMVAVNPRLQFQGPPSLVLPESGSVTDAMKMVPSSCDVDLDAATPDCVLNVPAMWAFLALTNRVEERINVAVLDMGFATNDDFRQPTFGEMIECSMVGGTPDCRPGAAQGPPTVGNSFFGPKTWHGTGVVTTLGGIVGNVGAAGVGGQVVVPMLYEYGFWAYAFEMGQGMRLATNMGASCINISGGYPCRILTNIGPDFFVCSREGRAKLCAEVVAAAAATAALVCATTGWIPIVGQLACGAAIGGVTVSAGACVYSLVRFADLRGPIESGVRYATNFGVPVVTIAGNKVSKESLPPVIRSYVDTSDHSTDRWHIMPAMVPEAIVVGSVDSSLDNTNFYGDRVDIWAPTPSGYMAPRDVDDINSTLKHYEIGATSAAAPFVSGVIAAMQAVNPNLNRMASEYRGLCSTEPGFRGGYGSTCRDIVLRIKSILTDEASSFSNAELVARNYSNQPVERRRLVDPLSAVTTAARDTLLPQLDGYPLDLNFDDGSLAGGNDDTRSGAYVIHDLASPNDFPYLMLGTVLGLSDRNRDQDWYQFTMFVPGHPLMDLDLYKATVTLQYPRAFGRPGMVAGDAQFTWGPERINEFDDADDYTVIAPYGTEVAFAVGGGNVYRLTLDEPELVIPTIEIVEPTASAELLVCTGDPVTFEANAFYEEAREFPVPSSAVFWTVNGADGVAGESMTYEFGSPGDYLVRVVVLGSDASEDTLAVTASTCTDLPPTATILTPSEDVSIDHDGTDPDSGMGYADVSLEGRAVDPEDGNLSGASLVWTTNRTDLQDALLGTGEALTVRLYVADICVGATHIVSLQATDTTGNPSPPVQRRIAIKSHIC